MSGPRIAPSKSKLVTVTGEFVCDLRGASAGGCLQETTAVPRAMAPKRKPAAKSSPSLSPRRTRSSSAPAPAAAAPPAKRQRKAAEGKQKDKAEEPEDAPAAKAGAGVDAAKTVIVEACKQCHQFKKRAMMVKDGLESDVPGVTVLVNPEKPRRGCFEIRDANGATFVSLLDMKRPFTPMMKLDVGALISDIIKKIK